MQVNTDEACVLNLLGSLTVTPREAKHAGSRVFLPPPVNRPPYKGPPVEVELKGLVDQLVGAQTPLNAIAQYAYQRLAPCGSVAVEHEKQKIKLAALNKQIKDAWTKAVGLFEEIPYMTDRDSQTKALSCLLELDFVSDLLMHKSKGAATLLDETRSSQLEFYKECVKKCEGKIDAEAVVDDVLNKIATPSTPIEESTYLYVLYATGSEKVERRLLYRFVPKLDPDPEDSTLPPVRSTKKLPAEHSFRNAPWLSMVTTIPYVGRFSAISTQKSNLETVTKALLERESLLYAQTAEMRRTFLGNKEQRANFCTALQEGLNFCKGLKRHIEAEIRSLARVPIAPEVHAGWNYAFSLLEQTSDLAEIMNLFLRNIDSFSSSVRAVNTLKYFIKDDSVPRSNPNLVRKTSSLWRATRPLFTLVKPVAVLEKTIATIASSELHPTDDEQRVPELVAKGTCEWHKAIESYLIKGLMTYLHYPVGPVGIIDPLFQKTFYELKFSPKYKDAFVDYLKNSKEFKALHDDYLGAHQKLYMFLIKQQYSTNQTVRNAADLQIYEILNHPDFKPDSVVGVVKPLLERWALIRFNELRKQPREATYFGFGAPSPIPISPGEKTLLKAIFDSYRTNPEQKAFWDSQFIPDDLEEAIKEFEAI